VHSKGPVDLVASLRQFLSRDDHLVIHPQRIPKVALAAGDLAALVWQPFVALMAPLFY